MQRQELITYLDKYLQVANFSDYCPNGLQVAGKDNINKIVTAVTACQSVIDFAIEQKADAILVHHGYFWKDEDPCITGIKQQRLKKLLQHDINLLAYHLPLDAHLQLGNNVELAKLLEFTVAGNNDFVFYGAVAKQTGQQLLDVMRDKLQRQPIWIAADKSIERVAWCTGAAQDYIEQAVQLSADAFISGEISERTYYQAKEFNMHYFAIGHHASERYGIQALGHHLAQHFSLDVQFIDTDNPV